MSKIMPSSATIRLDSRRVLGALLATIAVLVTMSTVAGCALYYFDWREESLGFRLVRLVWLDAEYNIPTMYQVSAMFVAAMLFALIGQRQKQAGVADTSRWSGLSIVMLFLGFDEGARIHELLGEILNVRFGASWTFLYVPAALLLLVWLMRFLLGLPARLLSLLLVSGTVYVTGAVGIEIASQVYAGAFGKWDAVYAGFATLEEALEMLGIALLIFALLEHLEGLEQPN
ncbi:MAG TPA: hypothetical protein VLD39_05450 [Gammaproteobacteria bacterium]|nr:hypothetical protein [Gammaproteobacteria bacterium]